MPDPQDAPHTRAEDILFGFADLEPITHWRWRHLSEGIDDPTVGPMAAAGDPLEAASTEAIYLSNRLNELTSLLGNRDANGLPGKPVLAWLADDERLLPTTPAWSQVEQALANWPRPELGREARQAYAKLLTEYSSMLRANDPIVDDALIFAAFLGGLSDAKDETSPETQALSRRIAMRFLSRSLGFDRMNQVELAENLQRLRDEMLDQNTYALPVPQLWNLPQTVDEALQGGRAAAERGIIEKSRDGALARWRDRYADFVNNGRDRACGVHELIAEYTAERPIFIARRISSVTLNEWTRVAVDGLRDSRWPGWMATAALERLGTTNLNAALRRQLWRDFRPKDDGERKLAETLQASFAGSATSSSRIVLAVCNELESQVETMTERPSAGLLFVATAEEIEPLLSRLDELMRVSKQPAPIVWWEIPMDDPALTLRASLERDARKSLDRFFGRRSMETTSTPLREITRADDFFA